jgi:hypothetical protein
MRPLAVILIWVVILGGLALYMQSREVFSPPPEHVYEIQPAPGVFTLEVIPTFDAEGGGGDFAIEKVDQPAFTLLLRGNEIVRYDDPMQAAQKTIIQWNLEKWPLEVGDNEFFIEMPAPQRDAFAVEDSAAENAVYGVRLRLLRDGAEVDSKTLWSEPGGPVQGAMFIELDRLPATNDQNEHST